MVAVHGVTPASILDISSAFFSTQQLSAVWKPIFVLVLTRLLTLIACQQQHPSVNSSDRQQSVSACTLCALHLRKYVLLTGRGQLKKEENIVGTDGSF